MKLFGTRFPSPFSVSLFSRPQELTKLALTPREMWGTRASSLVVLSGSESAILNRESSDSESRDSSRAIPRLRARIGCDLDGDSESIFRDSTLLRFDSPFASCCEFLCR